MTPLGTEQERTDDLALASVGLRGPASAEHNRMVGAARNAGIFHWERRIGRHVNPAEEDAIVVLADSLARADREDAA